METATRDRHLSESLLPIAVRAYTERVEQPSDEEPDRPHRDVIEPWPSSVLLIDTETTPEATQRLTFGSYRYCRWASPTHLDCVEEGLFYADDLEERDPASYRILRDYAASERADVVGDVDPTLHCYSLTAFLDRVFLLAAYRGRSLTACFNFPFDASRLARDSAPAGGTFAGGFSLLLWQYRDRKSGERKQDRYRPAIAIKAIDSKRALKRFGQRHNPDPVDVIPEGSLTGDPEERYAFRGHFLDLRTLAFALTNESHTLASAGKAFGVKVLKGSATHTGRITPRYIRYNRRDVKATAALLEKLREEHDRHPITLQPTQAYSPASVGKAYLDAMGIPPVLARQPDFPKQILGHAMSAFYGGRAECRIRKVPVPVVYCDFLSMYPTVNALMGLWNLLTAERIQVVEDTEGIKAFVEEITFEECFDPATWKQFPALVQVQPEEDILPVRAKYEGAESPNWQIGSNRLTSDQPLWYALPDVIAAKLLSGKTPTILKAYRLKAGDEKLGTLNPIQLRGAIPVDPAKRDFFAAVIEERTQVKGNATLDEEERKRLDKFLKVLANSASYGIFAEMVRQELPKGKRADVDLWGLFETPGRDRVIAPERPGRYCFPPLAACITAAARLMLALLERCVTDAGGSYAFCDTDSMAIVATEDGGLIRCPGGGHELGREAAIRALTWNQVDAIVARFKELNPYDRAVVDRSVLEIEEENFVITKDADGKKQRGPRSQLFCYAISAKRYALFNAGEDGSIAIRKRSEHGLGHLLNPLAPPEDEENEGRDQEDEDEQMESAVADRDDEAERGMWIRLVWERLIAEALGRDGPQLEWLEERPALSRISVSSPDMLDAFEAFNKGKEYADRVKPFNFLLGAHLADYGEPEGVKRERFQLIARFRGDWRQWLKMAWIDKYSKRTYRITTTGPTGGPGIARVQTYGDVVKGYRNHEEAKSAAPDRGAYEPETRGLLQRRSVRMETISYIGKESNRLLDVLAAQAHPSEAKPNEYYDERLDPWRTVIVPVLKIAPLTWLHEETGISESQLKRLRNGHSLPHATTRARLIRAAADFARHEFGMVATGQHLDNIAICATYFGRREDIT